MTNSCSPCAAGIAARRRHRLLGPALALALLLGAGPAAADDPLPSPERAADAAVAAIDGKDAAALRALAAKEPPDPWLVADELASRGRSDAATAFAAAVAPRKDTDALPGYVGARAGKGQDEKVAKARAAFAAALRATDPKASLAALEGVEAPEGEVVSVRIAQRRGTALAAVGRPEEGAKVLEAGGLSAQRMGWLAGASGLLQQAASTRFQRGDYIGALATWQERLAVEEARGSRVAIAATLGNFGLVYRYLGDLPKALSFSQRSRKMFEEAARPSGVARSLVILSAVYRALGDYAKALASGEQALTLMESIGDAVGAAYAAASLGNVLGDLGDSDAALAAYEHARGPIEAAKDSRALALLLVNTAVLYEGRGEFARARALLEDALGRFEKAHDVGSEWQALEDLADVLRLAGDAPAALAASEKALRLTEEIGARDGVANALISVGLAQRLLGRREEALAVFDRAAREAERVRASPVLVQALEEAAWTRLDAGQPEEALAAVRRAVPYVETMVGRQDEEHGIASRGRHATLFAAGLAASFDLARPADAVYFLESGRAGALLEALGNAEALQAAVLPEPVRAAGAQARALEAAARTAYAHAVERGARAEIDGARAALDAAHEGRVKAIEEIQRGEKSAAEVFYPRAATLEEIEGWLEDGDALALYGYVSTRVLALVVTRKAARLVSVGKVADVDAACAAATPSDPRADASASLAALRAAIVDPLALDASTRRVLVSPEGAIAFAPLGALFPGRDVAFVPSATTYGLLRDERAAKPGAGILALGDPDYMTKPAPRAVALARSGLHLVPLPATREEARAVADVSLLGAEASRAGLLAALPRRPRWRAVHFACHGIVDVERPALSALALSASGEDDGLLTALDAFRMEIPADLVTLSACETGKGKIAKGEGIVGLARAFMFAGAPRVLCSLWRVDDEATRALMVKFYSLWSPKDGSKPMPTAAALRAAQEYVRTHEIEAPDDEATKRAGHAVTRRVRPWEHPYYWAAWVLWGLAE